MQGTDIAAYQRVGIQVERALVGRVWKKIEFGEKSGVPFCVTILEAQVIHLKPRVADTTLGYFMRMRMCCIDGNRPIVMLTKCPDRCHHPNGVAWTGE